MPTKSVISLVAPLALLLVAAGCAHSRTEIVEEREFLGAMTVVTDVVIEEDVAPAAPPRLRRPQREMDRRDRFETWKPPAVSDPIVLPEPGEGYTWKQIFGLIQEHTGHIVFWDTDSAIIHAKRIRFSGAPRIDRRDLIAWAQDVGAQHDLSIRPLGPVSRQQWVAMDHASTRMTSNPQFISEDDLHEYQGREGVHIACALSLPEGVDGARARQALSQFSTKYAGIGGISEIDSGHVLLVADFASIVARMRRLLDEMAIARWQAQQE